MPAAPLPLPVVPLPPPPADRAIPAPLAPAVQPAHAESGAALRDAAPDSLPQSRILDRWKDSGKPLR